MTVHPPDNSRETVATVLPFEVPGSDPAGSSVPRHAPGAEIDDADAIRRSLSALRDTEQHDAVFLTTLSQDVRGREIKADVFALESPNANGSHGLRVVLRDDDIVRSFRAGSVDLAVPPSRFGTSEINYARELVVARLRSDPDFQTLADRLTGASAPLGLTDAPETSDESPVPDTALHAGTVTAHDGSEIDVFVDRAIDASGGHRVYLTRRDPDGRVVPGDVSRLSNGRLTHVVPRGNVASSLVGVRTVIETALNNPETDIVQIFGGGPASATVNVSESDTSRVHQALQHLDGRKTLVGQVEIDGEAVEIVVLGAAQTDGSYPILLIRQGHDGQPEITSFSDSYHGDLSHLLPSRDGQSPGHARDIAVYVGEQLRHNGVDSFFP